jgi:hypothetical protein
MKPQNLQETLDTSETRQALEKNFDNTPENKEPMGSISELREEVKSSVVINRNDQYQRPKVSEILVTLAFVVGGSCFCSLSTNNVEKENNFQNTPSIVQNIRNLRLNYLD